MALLGRGALRDVGAVARAHARGAIRPVDHPKRTTAMRLRITIALCALLAGAASSAISGTNQLRLAWDYPTNNVSDDLAFTLRYSPSLAVPTTNWNTLATVSATNQVLTGIAVTTGTNYMFTTAITNQPGAWFFVATATNVWGESDPSNVAATPPLPKETKLRIQR